MCAYAYVTYSHVLSPLDGYCNTLQVLLDWFEVDLASPSFVYSDWLVYICICHVFVGIVFSIRHLFVCIVFSPVGLSTAFSDENGTIYVYVTYEFVHIHSQFFCVVFSPIGLTNDVYIYIYTCILYCILYLYLTYACVHVHSRFQILSSRQMGWRLIYIYIYIYIIYMWHACVHIQSRILCVVFSPDGLTIAFGDEGGTVRLHDAVTTRVKSRIAIGR